jgi:hypothetical protein
MPNHHIWLLVVKGKIFLKEWIDSISLRITIWTDQYGFLLFSIHCEQSDGRAEMMPLTTTNVREAFDGRTNAWRGVIF